MVKHGLSCLIYYLHTISSVRTAIYTRHLINYSDWKTTLILKCSVCTCNTLSQAAIYGATLLWTDRMKCKKVGNLATICSGSQFSSSSIRSHSLQWRWISVWTGKQDNTKRLTPIWRTFLTDWVTDWLTGLTGCLAAWLTDWLAGLLADSLSDGRTDRLDNSLTDQLTNWL